MSTPHHYYSPRVPAIPNSTSSAASTGHVQARLGSLKATRGPVQNPYDKFKQGEFDSWIGGITGALRRALGQEDEPAEVPKSTRVVDTPTGELAYKDVDMEREQEDNSMFEDSFADFKSRKEAKGKARDPREGPGLRGEGWNKEEPIELSSSDEEEGTELVSEEEEYDSEEDEEVEEQTRLGFLDDLDRPQDTRGWSKHYQESSLRHAASRSDEELSDQEDEDDTYLDEIEEADENRSPSPMDGSSGQIGIITAPRPTAQQSEPVVYELDTDEEDEEDEEEVLKDLSPQLNEQLDGDTEEGREGGEEDILSDDEMHVSHISARHELSDEDVSDSEGAQPPRLSPVTVNGGEIDELDLEGEEEEEEEVHTRSSPPIEILDDDDEEDEFAADNDSFERDDLSEISPIGTLQYLPQADDEDVDEQPLDDDTSFPPHVHASEDKREFTVRDPWEGPQLYAEDFYAGGDRAVVEGGHTDPSFLGDNLEMNDVSEDFTSEGQEIFPPDNGTDADLPVELPDVWDGPRQLAEDFYAGGDFKVEESESMNVHTLEEDREIHFSPHFRAQGQPLHPSGDTDPITQDVEEVALEKEAFRSNNDVGQEEVTGTEDDAARAASVEMQPIALTETEPEPVEVDRLVDEGREVHSEETAPVPTEDQVIFSADAAPSSIPQMVVSEQASIQHDETRVAIVPDIDGTHQAADIKEQAQPGLGEQEADKGSEVIMEEPEVIHLEEQKVTSEIPTDESLPLNLVDIEVSSSAEEARVIPELYVEQIPESPVDEAQIEVDSQHPHDDSELAKAELGEHRSVAVLECLRTTNTTHEVPKPLDSVIDVETATTVEDAEVKDEKDEHEVDVTVEEIDVSEEVVYSASSNTTLEVEATDEDADGELDHDVEIISVSTGADIAERGRSQEIFDDIEACMDVTVEEQFSSLAESSIEAGGSAPSYEEYEAAPSSDDAINAVHASSDIDLFETTSPGRDDLDGYPLTASSSMPEEIQNSSPEIVSADSTTLDPAPPASSANESEQLLVEPSLDAPDASTRTDNLEATMSGTEKLVNDDVTVLQEGDMDQRKGAADATSAAPAHAPTGTYLTDDDQGNPLPPNWERRSDQDGRPYYLDHNTRTTQWDSPVASILAEQPRAEEVRASPEVKVVVVGSAEQTEIQSMDGPDDTSGKELSSESTESVAKAVVDEMEVTAQAKTVTIHEEATLIEVAPSQIADGETLLPTKPDLEEDGSSAKPVNVDPSDQAMLKEPTDDTDVLQTVGQESLPPTRAVDYAQPPFSVDSETRPASSNVGDQGPGTALIQHDVTVPRVIETDNQDAVSSSKAPVVVADSCSATSNHIPSDDLDPLFTEALTDVSESPDTSMTPRHASTVVGTLAQTPMTTGTSRYGPLSSLSPLSPILTHGPRGSCSDPYPANLSTPGRRPSSASTSTSAVDLSSGLLASKLLHNNVSSTPAQSTKPGSSAVCDVFGEPSHPPQQASKRNGQMAAPPLVESSMGSLSPAKGKRKRKAPKKKNISKSKEDGVESDGPVEEAGSIHVKPRSKGKGKETVKDTNGEVTNPAPVSAASSGSSASSAARIIQPGSRASSVASTTATGSVERQPLAPSTIPNPPPPPILPPRSLFHTHGQKRKQSLQLGLTFPPPSQSQPTTLPGRVPSFSRLSDRSSPLSPTTPQTDHLPLPAPPPTSGMRKSQSWVKSPVPVTRSHCRFHKISIPKDDDGPRVYFIVPGCALTKEDTIEEEEIIDHGEATYEDSLRMVAGVESLGFRDYLVSVLRLLVGAEIFREGEIFYLPLPGEEIQIQRKPFASSSRQSAVHRAGSSSTTRRSLAGDRSSHYESSDDDDVNAEYREKKHPAKKARLVPSEKTELPPVSSSSSHNPSSSKHGPSPLKSSQSAPGSSLAPAAAIPLLHTAHKRTRDAVANETTPSLSSLSEVDEARPSKKLKTKIPTRRRDRQ